MKKLFYWLTPEFGPYIKIRVYAPPGAFWKEWVVQDIQTGALLILPDKDLYRIK